MIKSQRAVHNMYAAKNIAAAILMTVDLQKLQLKLHSFVLSHSVWFALNIYDQINPF